MKTFKIIAIIAAAAALCSCKRSIDVYETYFYDSPLETVVTISSDEGKLSFKKDVVTVAVDVMLNFKVPQIQSSSSSDFIFRDPDNVLALVVFNKKSHDSIELSLVPEDVDRLVDLLKGNVGDETTLHFAQSAGSIKESVKYFIKSEGCNAGKASHFTVKGANFGLVNMVGKIGSPVHMTLMVTKDHCYGQLYYDSIYEKTGASLCVYGGVNEYGEIHLGECNPSKDNKITAYISCVTNGDNCTGNFYRNKDGKEFKVNLEAVYDRDFIEPEALRCNIPDFTQMFDIDRYYDPSEYDNLTVEELLAKCESATLYANKLYTYAMEGSYGVLEEYWSTIEKAEILFTSLSRRISELTNSQMARYISVSELITRSLAYYW